MRAAPKRWRRAKPSRCSTPPRGEHAWALAASSGAFAPVQRRAAATRTTIRAQASRTFEVGTRSPNQDPFGAVGLLIGTTLQLANQNRLLPEFGVLCPYSGRAWSVREVLPSTAFGSAPVMYASSSRSPLCCSPDPLVPQCVATRRLRFNRSSGARNGPRSLLPEAALRGALVAHAFPDRGSFENRAVLVGASRVDGAIRDDLACLVALCVTALVTVLSSL
jgi:hypothetical protein